MNFTAVAPKLSALSKDLTTIFASKSFLVRSLSGKSLASLFSYNSGSLFDWFIKPNKRALLMVLIVYTRSIWSYHALILWRLRKGLSQRGYHFLRFGSAVLLWKVNKVLVDQSWLNGGHRELLRGLWESSGWWGGWYRVGKIYKIRILPKTCLKGLDAVFLGWEGWKGNFLVH